MEYYIFDCDQIGMTVVDALIERAESGVKVYLLCDALGSRGLKKSVIAQMKQSGIEVALYDPVWITFLSSNVNHCNHRKIFVVDGELTITGGINIGDEYNHFLQSLVFGVILHCLICKRLVFCNWIATYK